MSNSAGPSPGASRFARWAILLLTCGGLFGQFFAFDIPSALNEQMKQLLMKPTGITEQEFAYYFSLLYSVYSIPNVILPLVLGIAVDRCGCRALIVLLGLSVVLGHLLFTLGVSASSWPIMLAGRALFGLGGESLQVAQNCLLFRWFRGHEVAFALGLNLSVARAGSVLNDVASPWAAQRWGVMGAMWLGALLCCGSFACNALSVVLDKFEGQKAAMPESVNDETVSLSDIFRMPKLYWLLASLCVIIYCGILPFNNIASAFFVETRFSSMRLSDAQQQAGAAMSLLFLSSAIGTPPFGLIVDHVGMRRHFLFFSAGLLATTYATISAVSPACSMLMLGFVYMIFAGALWPSFALTVPQRQLGSAYGVATALQNAGLAATPLLVGHLQATQGPGHFEMVIRLFLLFGVAGVIIASSMFAPNVQGTQLLDLPSLEAERRAKATERTPLQVSGGGGGK
mmetsp:Transcript_50038/g.131850  ORF Transcript_50038/g.131850 Transcript_50038/m.131850 type:complete len:456 (+) Transcript_50038:107-1474(+)